MVRCILAIGVVVACFSATEGGEYHLQMGPHKVAALAFSPDGNLIASLSTDQVVRVWNKNASTPIWAKHVNIQPQDGIREKRISYRGVNGVPQLLSFSFDNKTLIAGGENDSWTRRWQAKTGVELPSAHESPGGQFRCVRGCGVDGDTLVSWTGDHQLFLWSASTKKVVAKKKMPSLQTCFAGKTFCFSPKADVLAIWAERASKDGVVIEWLLYLIAIPSLQISHQFVIKAEDSPLPHLDDDRWYHNLHRLHRNTITGVCFSKDGKLLVAGTLHSLFLFDLDNKHCRRLRIKEEEIHSCLITPNGKSVAALTWSHNIHFWDFHSGRIEAVDSNGSRDILSMCFSPDSQWIATGNSDGAVIVRKMSSVLGKRPFIVRP